MPSAVPMSTVESLPPRALMAVLLARPALIGVHEVPLLVETKPPSEVPAKMLSPFTASAYTYRFDKPVLTAVHEAPWSFERNTPSPSVPAKRLPLPAARLQTFEVA